MRIALAQLNPRSGDIEGNSAAIVDALERAIAAGADLMVTPEMALPGYCIGDLVDDLSFLEANEAAMRRIAAAGLGSDASVAISIAVAAVAVLAARVLVRGFRVARAVRSTAGDGAAQIRGNERRKGEQTDQGEFG